MAANEIASLVKFCDIQTGLKILNSQSLRWSSPHLFNDPFELDHTSKVDITPDQLIQGIIKEAINLLFGPTEPSGKQNRLVAAIARWREEERFASEDEAGDVLKQLLAQIAEQQQQAISEYSGQWVDFAQRVRICCFCDKPTNLNAWQRFGDNHAGIALRFSCGEHTALPNPHRVSYSSVPPTLTSLKEQVDVCYGRQDAPSTDDFVPKLLSKNKSNNTEREWRCINIDKQEHDTQSNEELWYDNKKFSSPELKAVYLGLSSAANEKATIIDLIKKKYQQTKIYQAHRLPGRYEIEFKAVTSK